MIIVRLPSHFPVRATEWMMAAMKASFGLLLLMPLDMFAQPSFTAMRQMAHQHAWGTLGFVFGSVHLIALYINGTRRRSPHVRAFCSCVSSLFWLMVCVGFFRSPVPTTGWAIYPWLVVFSLRNVVSASRDARQSDDKHRSEETYGGGY